MNVFIYPLILLFIAFIASLIVRQKTNEMFQLWYCLIAPLTCGALHLLLPAIFPELEDVIFKGNSGQDFLYINRFTHVWINFPVLVMSCYAINLIVLPVVIKPRKKQLPEDHFDKW